MLLGEVCFARKVIWLFLIIQKSRVISFLKWAVFSKHERISLALLSKDPMLHKHFNYLSIVFKEFSFCRFA